RQVQAGAGWGARVPLAAVDEQVERLAAAGRIVQPLPELIAQNLQQLVELMDREAAVPEVGEHQQLEQLDRRVAPLGVAARRRLVRRNRRRQQTACVPDLELARREAGPRRRLPRG